VILKRITGGACFGKLNFEQKQIKFLLANLFAKICLHDKVKSQLFIYSESIDPEYKTIAQL